MVISTNYPASGKKEIKKIKDPDGTKNLHLIQKLLKLKHIQGSTVYHTKYPGTLNGEAHPGSVRHCRGRWMENSLWGYSNFGTNSSTWHSLPYPVLDLMRLYLSLTLILSGLDLDLDPSIHLAWPVPWSLTFPLWPWYLNYPSQPLISTLPTLTLIYALTALVLDIEISHSGPGPWSLPFPYWIWTCPFQTLPFIFPTQKCTWNCFTLNLNNIWRVLGA